MQLNDYIYVHMYTIYTNISKNKNIYCLFLKIGEFIEANLKKASAGRELD